MRFDGVPGPKFKNWDREPEFSNACIEFSLQRSRRFSEADALESEFDPIRSPARGVRDCNRLAAKDPDRCRAAPAGCAGQGR